jgi:hypothetical protein
MVDTSYEQIKAVTLKLLAYCKANDWAGYDPYDALNSEIFKALPFLDFRLPRLALTQMVKKSPFNFRPLFLVPKTQNPKAIALFLMAFLKLDRLGLLEDKELIPLMIQKLIDLRSPNDLITRNSQLATGNYYFCWGYSFPWQTRTILVPRGAPNLVCTTFVANALLDAYEQGCEPKMSNASSEADLQPSPFGGLCLDMAVSAADYILNELYWTEDDSVAGFSYPLPKLRTQVHNANFLGAAVLCRVYKHCTEKKFLEPALKVTQYSAAKQHADGSWYYGEWPGERWVDNFHTGYNLCALQSICKYADTSEFEAHIRRGFEFYKYHFIREDCAPKYFHDRTYPIDIHSVAQSIITLLEFKNFGDGIAKLAHSVIKWTMTHMWDDRGYFYYQVLPFRTTKIPYTRWSQAWMLLALSTLLEECDQDMKRHIVNYSGLNTGGR